MSIRFACRCGKKMKVPDDKIGKKVLCSDCGSPVVVPESDTVAVETVSVGAADRATDLLKGSGARAKPRSHFAFDDHPEDAGAYDARETAKHLIPIILLGAFVVLVISLATYWVASSLMLSGPITPDLGEVRGTVTLDGKPLAYAMVQFHPDSGLETGSRIGSSAATTNSEGEYRLAYVGDVYGAAIGKHRVTIQAPNLSRERRLPRKYTSVRGTVLHEEVEAGNNEINLDLFLE
jgi:DNA-directed RNA polymerase subunit RPC12/RpoP